MWRLHRGHVLAVLVKAQPSLPFLHFCVVAMRVNNVLTFERKPPQQKEKGLINILSTSVPRMRSCGGARLHIHALTRQCHSACTVSSYMSATCRLQN